jgi:hypothetical protein
LFDENNIYNCSVGLHHMLEEVFNKLFSSEASRQVVEFPVSVRTADKHQSIVIKSVYRDLRKLG